jgi:hypothetical protein
MNRKSIARVAGFNYFLFIALFIFSTVLRSQLVIKGDAFATISNISREAWVFQLSIVTELVSLLLFFGAAWTLYCLLQSIGKEMALLFLFLNAIGVAVECVSNFSLIGILLMIPKLTLYSESQQQNMVTLLLQLYQNGFMVAQLFFSTWLLPLGYLIYKSRFLPKALGILIILDFFFWFLYFLQYFLLPNFKVITYISFPIAFAAEFSLTLWLVFKGAKDVGKQ